MAFTDAAQSQRASRSLMAESSAASFLRPVSRFVSKEIKLLVPKEVVYKGLSVLAMFDLRSVFGNSVLV